MFRETVTESKKSDELAKGIDKVMLKIDEDMSVTDFALAVAKILKDEYGTHNYKSFTDTLKKEL